MDGWPNGWMDVRFVCVVFVVARLLYNWRLSKNGLETPGDLPLHLHAGGLLGCGGIYRTKIEPTPEKSKHKSGSASPYHISQYHVFGLFVCF